MATRRKTWIQLELPKPRMRGGVRPRAGRKRRTDELPHLPRPQHKARFPLHVTQRIRWEVGSLRTDKRFQRIKRAFRYGCDRFGMRMLDFSIQDDHIHLIVEANDKESLSRGMQGLTIRVARAINRVSGRRGKVFADRYFARPLRTPTEVKNAIHYVRYNMQHHRAEKGLDTHPWALDPFSSVTGEAQWYGEEHRTVAEPRSWLVRNAPS